MKNSIVALGLLITLGACNAGGPINPPAEGYEAIRFKRPVSVRDHGINTITFITGSTLVADHQSRSGQVYCGMVIINDLYSTKPYCFGVEGDRTLIDGPGDILKAVRREIPPDSIERIRMKR